MPLTAEQLKLRETTIGASEAPAVLGLSPFATPADIYWRKVGKPEADKPTEAMESGTRLEPVILDWCGERLGRKVIDRGVMMIDPISGCLSAIPDGRVEGRRELVESKKTSLTAGWGDEGTDQIPENYLVQCHEQMEVAARCGILIERVWVPVLMLAGFREEWRLYCVERNEDLGAEIAGRCTAFYKEHIEARVPPDGSTPPLDIIKRLRREPKSQVILGGNGIEAWEALDKAKAAAKEADAKKDEAQAAVLALLGIDNPAESALLPDGRLISYLSQKSAPSVDSARLRAEFPAAYEACFKQGTHRTLRIRKGE